MAEVSWSRFVMGEVLSSRAINKSFAGGVGDAKAEEAASEALRRARRLKCMVGELGEGGMEMGLMGVYELLAWYYIKPSDTKNAGREAIYILLPKNLRACLR
jgi:hypothetical protein